MATRLPLEVQTLYAELLDALRARALGRAFGHLAGGFTKKTSQRGVHWYFRTSEGAAGAQDLYVGPDTEATLAILESYRAARQGALEEERNIHRLATMLRAGGVPHLGAATGKVLHALEAAGIFRLGGVLVGTHAFLALGTMLGVRWDEASRTQDIDVAARRTFEVAVDPRPMDVPSTLEALAMGFLPVPGLDPRMPSTAFKVRGQTLKVDLLTPEVPKHTGPVPIPRFRAAAEPLPFLDFILRETAEACVIDGTATLVRVPDPARFALHKFAVADRRPVSEQAKAVKDRIQAARIIEVLDSDRPGDLDRALDALAAHGGGWAARVARSAKRDRGLPDSFLERLEALGRGGRG
jgi:hypothetical protein